MTSTEVKLIKQTIKKKQMKQTIKSLVAAVFFTCMGTIAFAQTPATVTVTAKVLKPIVLTPTNVLFGAVTAGQVPILDPIDPADNEQVSVQATPGRLLVSATGGEVIRVTWPAEVDLVKSGSPTDIINYVPRLSVIWDDIAIGSTDRQNSVLMDDDSAFPAGTAATGTAGTGIGGLGYFSTNPLPASELASIFIGGNLYEDGSTTNIVPANQATGTYTANMVLTIDYFGL